MIGHHLDGATFEHPYCATLELWPIVEDELFGYELVPDRETRTYVIIGSNALGKPALRTVSYGTGSSSRRARNVQLATAATQGQRLCRLDKRRKIRLRSNTLFVSARLPEHSVASRPHRHLEDALALAYSHLARWDPLIEFFGLPNEAQLGFPLLDSNGKQGELIFAEPDTWLLHWHVAPDVVIELWSIAIRETFHRVSRSMAENIFQTAECIGVVLPIVRKCRLAGPERSDVKAVVAT